MELLAGGILQMQEHSLPGIFLPLLGISLSILGILVCRHSLIPVMISHCSRSVYSLCIRTPSSSSVYILIIRTSRSCSVYILCIRTSRSCSVSILIIRPSGSS